MEARGSRLLGSLAVLALFAAACAAVPPLPTQVPPTSTPRATPVRASPSPAGLSPEVRQSLDAVLDNWVDRGLVPSLSAAVIIPGLDDWAGAAGVADISSDAPAEPATTYAIGSITKTYTAAVVLRLAEQGALDLDEPAANWLDDADIANGATIRQLLSMRSGIHDPVSDDPGFFDALVAEPDRVWSPSEVLEWVGQPHGAPGEEYRYSNTNYVLLGLIAEAAAERPAHELVADLVEPLGLARTVLGPEQHAAQPVAHGYVGSGDDLDDVTNDSLVLPAPAFASAAWTAGGMAAPAADVAAWADALYGGRVLSAESLVEMLDFGADYRYGLGTAPVLLAPGRPAIGHLGGTAGFTSLLVHVPESRATIVVVANKMNFDLLPAARQLAQAVPELAH